MCIFVTNSKTFSLKLAYFIANRLRSSKDYKSSVSAPIIKIAITAIAIGMVMMIISVATGIGLQQKIREKISAFNGHITISKYNDNQSKVSVDPIAIHQDFYPKFKNISGISHVQAVATKAGIIRTATSFEGIIFKGVGKEYDWKHLNEFLVEGRLPVVSNDLNQEVLISQYLANRLNLKLGNNCPTFFMKKEANQLPNLRVFKIVGIYNSGFQEFDAMFLIGDIRHVQKINHWNSDQIGNFEVFIDDFSLIKQKGKEVYQQTNSSLDTKTIIDKYQNIFDWLQLFDFNILTILIIMILVATINIIVALLVIILERTQMIGMLKALGATNWTIRKIFLINASNIILKGMLWGNIIGIGLLLIQKYFSVIKLPPENYYVNVAPVTLDWCYFLLLNIGTALITLLFLLIPSYIITKVTPSQALRFE